MELLVSLSAVLLSIYELILARGVRQRVKKLDGERTLSKLTNTGGGTGAGGRK